MDRRSFMRGAAIAAAASPTLAGSALAEKGGRRISVVEGDPGERFYAECCGDRRKIAVFLDGVEQAHAITADEAEGFVYRLVTTENGNPAFNRVRNDFLHETVYGDVKIEIGAPGSGAD